MTRCLCCGHRLKVRDKLRSLFRGRRRLSYYTIGGDLRVVVARWLCSRCVWHYSGDPKPSQPRTDPDGWQPAVEAEHLQRLADEQRQPRVLSGDQ